MPFVNLENIEGKKIIEGAEAKFVHSEGMTFATWNFTAGAKLPEHSHPHEQISRLIKGQFELTVDGEPKILTENDIAVIPSGAVHSGRAISDCLVIDVFHPVREDYR
jgi:quercetin dioxygenase-like cupin family protein